MGLVSRVTVQWPTSFSVSVQKRKNWCKNTAVCDESMMFSMLTDHAITDNFYLRFCPEISEWTSHDLHILRANLVRKKEHPFSSMQFLLCKEYRQLQGFAVTIELRF